MCLGHRSLHCGNFSNVTVHWAHSDKRFIFYTFATVTFFFTIFQKLNPSPERQKNIGAVDIGSAVSKMNNNSTKVNTTQPTDRVDEGSLQLPGVTYSIVVFGFCANSFICFAFGYYRRIRTVHNYFVFNLAISDLISMLSLCLFLALPAMRKTMSDENREILEMALLMFEVFCGSASIANLTVISYDRYYSVTKPLHYTANITHRKALLFIVCIWGYALTVALLQLLYLVPDVFKYGYTPFLALFNSVIPLAVTMYCYITIFIIASSHLRNNPHRNRDPSAPANILTKNLKIAFHILVLVAPLLVCWSSYFAIGVVEMYCVKCIPLTPLGNWLVSMMVHILGAVDPVIYIFLTKDLRKIIFSFFKPGNRPYSVSETFHLSTTRSTNAHASPGSGSETRIVDKDQMASSYRRYWKCVRQVLRRWKRDLQHYDKRDSIQSETLLGDAGRRLVKRKQKQNRPRREYWKTKYILWNFVFKKNKRNTRDYSKIH